MLLDFSLSTITIVTQLGLSHFIRKSLDGIMEEGLLKEAATELIVVAELCGACFELVIIADYYPIWTFALCLFLMTIWWSQSWGSAAACPYYLLEDYVEHDTSLTNLLVKVAAQTVGAILSFKWVKQLWLLELASTHVGRGMDECSADLQVPVFYGFLIECFLTCSCRLFSRAIGELEPRYSLAIDSFFSTSMVIIAFNYSGGYFNPVLATGLKWGCRGHSHTEHIIVYWAGSILGSMLSLKLWKIATFKRTLLSPFKEVDVIKKFKSA